MRGTAKMKEYTGSDDEQKAGRGVGSVEKVLDLLLRMTANRTHKDQGPLLPSYMLQRLFPQAWLPFTAM